jgi:hypothetical protein
MRPANPPKTAGLKLPVMIRQKRPKHKSDEQEQEPEGIERSGGCRPHPAKATDREGERYGCRQYSTEQVRS